ncbi:MAG TPA: hypothetical protein VHN14_04125 [Kofleriaceae bacterium]|jgi:hypothetical protein|nr:hypothetical protein [Kofleriaceae bacterium]
MRFLVPRCLVVCLAFSSQGTSTTCRRLASAAATFFGPALQALFASVPFAHPQGLSQALFAPAVLGNRRRTLQVLDRDPGRMHGPT